MKPPDTAAPLFEIPAAFLHEQGVVRLLEPPDADTHRLVMQLLDGVYPKPFVIDDRTVRRLHFSLALTQSEMLIAQPHALHLAYTRRMMAGLLFMPRPKHIVIVGLGGGSLAKFCHRQLARTRITALEVSPEVIALRDQFCLPPDDARLTVQCIDAVEYFACTEDRADLVLLDGYDDNGITPGFCDERFYTALRARLRPGGVLVANLALRSPDSAAHLALLRETFAGRVLLLDVPVEGNRVAFAFADADFPPDWPRVARTARTLGGQLGLEFPAFAQELARNAQRQARRA